MSKAIKKGFNQIDERLMFADYFHPTRGYMRVMAYSEGWYMCRWKGAIPFVKHESDIVKYFKETK